MDRQIRIRNRTAGQIEAILMFAKKIDEDTTEFAIRPRLDDLMKHHADFQELEIDLHAFVEYQPVTAKVDAEYYAARTLLEDALAQRTARNEKLIKNSDDLNETLESFVAQQKTFYESINTTSSVKLPKINVEPFSGDYKMWPSFRDLYLNTVHNHPHLKGAQKLQQLKSILRGEAAGIIRHISTTDKNYEEAWKKLEARYNKPKPIVSTLIQSFINQRPCKSTNYKDLRRLYDHSDEVVRALRSLGEREESRDPWLIFLLLEKVDNDTKQLWARDSVNNLHPTFAEFLEFLNIRCDTLESCSIEDKRVTRTSTQPSKSFLVEPSTPIVQKFICYACKGDHMLFKCPTFRNNNLESRIALVNDQRLCHNCLRKGHFSSDCLSKTSCLICRKKHHSLLHSQGPNYSAAHHAYIDSPLTPVNQSDKNNEIPNEKLHTPLSISTKPSTNHVQNVNDPVCSKPRNEATKTHTAIKYYSEEIHSLMLLPTAIVNVQSRSGNFQPARALLDSGSQSCFITESCIQRLGLSRTRSNIQIYGLASVPAGTTKGKTSLVIKSRVNDHYTINMTTHIVKNITSNLPTKDFNVSQPALNKIQLADPYFNKSSTIDLLIGIEFFFEILGTRKQKITGLPELYESKFGWLVAGDIQQNSVNCITSMPGYTNTDNECDNAITQDLLKKFWEVEELPNEQSSLERDDVCENYYLSTTEITKNGRYQVRLPFKTPRTKLGESFTSAKRRLFAVERRFMSNPEFKDNYTGFIQEYKELGHMHEVKWIDLPEDDENKYFLPHHAVFKESSTTRLRVVFDASCKTSNSVSLNDTLHVGPKIQLDLSTILLKFRLHQIAFVADIEKMYRQIQLHPEDKPYQLILWRENGDLKVYMLDTITYGLASAPYMAVRTLKAIADENTNKYPEESSIISNDFYVDDLLSGANTIEKAEKLKLNLIKILESRGLHLRKWRSNSNEFLQSFSKSEVENIPKLIENEQSLKTLGIFWDSRVDAFTFEVNLKSLNNWTKRKILSEVARIYDPLGWVSPIIILFKLIIQKLWIQRCDWDSTLHHEITEEFENLYCKLPQVNNIKIPRCYFTSNQLKSTEMHAFSDASEKAYGCVVYVRCTYADNSVNTSLVCAKSKVAPINQITLPRLELCAAFLMCKLVKYIKSDIFKNKEIKIYAWTDSMVVLHWLSDVPRRWKNFVANRTSKMLEIIPVMSWHHVPSKQNPADLISRGVQPDKLNDLELWWKGPSWLIKDNSHWPSSRIQKTKNDASMLEAKKSVLHQRNVEIEKESSEISELTERVSSWYKLKKIVVIILRFARRSIDQKIRICGPVLVKELIRAETVIIRSVQKISFKHEIKNILNKGHLESNSKLLGLDPFIDREGVIRVGGRLKHSNLKFSAKHPIILPQHRINDLIIREIHISHLHAGLNLMLNTIRQRFWMLNARRSVKKFINRCIVCIKYRGSTSQQKMGDLPASRVTEQRPFLNVGIDNAGPVYVKSGLTRNARMEKAYLTLFVCLSIKAVHIEIVSSMTTEAFLAAFKRFVARRGIPENVFCDNGSNFVAGNNELKILRREVLQQFKGDEITTYGLQRHITFHFNPPAGAHFGGLWEASVKSTKYHMKRVMNNVNFTFEELTTLTSQIESILNSRPLCCITDDVSELQVLTPSHFLIGEALTAVPEPQLDEVKESKLNRWQNIQKRMQGFWKSWRTDYLHTLQERAKWKNLSSDFQINDVVLLKDKNLPPNQWPFGIVTQIHPGKDDIVRVVKIKCNNKEYTRPIDKLVKLPVNNNT